ncbi:DUF3179 domain-containing protein [Acidobacteria bacterium AH-259-L09]|nr:DUF3179 domain-containing protein [Acidobacteria bacterium AH-259-L09]
MFKTTRQYRKTVHKIETILVAVLLLPAMVATQLSSSDWKSAWPNTDFSKRIIDLSSLESGGPPRDGIPPIDHPRFVSVEEASQWMADREPVIVLELNGDVHAYPLQIMVWHEIVNDTVGGVPVSVTFCPLCYSAIAFDRRVKGKVYDFGTSGLLRHSDLVMYDRQTESLWQQLSGEAIVGQMVGHTLEMIPAALIGFGRFKSEHANGKVLSKETGYRRAYGRNPYAGYDDIRKTPFLYRGPLPKKVKPMEHLVTVMINGEPVAYPFSSLKKRPVVNDKVGGLPIVVFYEKTMRTALGREKIKGGKAVGAGAVFERRVDGRTLSFTKKREMFMDLETGSVWNMFGVATSGPLKGKRLKRIVSGDFFAFAWMAFRPHTRIYTDR